MQYENQTTKLTDCSQMNIKNSKQAYQKMPNTIININIILLKKCKLKAQ